MRDNITLFSVIPPAKKKWRLAVGPVIAAAKSAFGVVPGFIGNSRTTLILPMLFASNPEHHGERAQRIDRILHLCCGE
jgi:hypothetical protein